MINRAIRWSLFPIGDYEQHARSWDVVNAAAGGLPFLESRFLGPLIRHSGSSDGLLALGKSDDLPVAAALLQRAGFGRLATFQPSQLPLGAWLVASGLDQASVAESLLEALPYRVLALGLSQQDPHFWSRPPDNPRLRTIDYIKTGWINVSGGFDAFWDSRGKNLRSNLRKQRNKLASENTRVSFERLTSVDEVAAAVEDFGRLEGAGWKAEIGTAVLSDSSQGRFYTEMMRAFCAAGQGEIWQLLLDDKVVAIDLCILSGGTLVILKTAYDPEYRSVSPAFMLKQDAFKQIFDEGRFRRIEFYGRLMEWHTRWTDEVRTLYHANLFRWNWVTKLRDSAHRAAPAQAQVPSNSD